MKRTPLAVGIAVLVSLMWIPEYEPYVGRYRVSILAQIITRLIALD